MNIQDKNVGNLGDVVKHAALVALAEVLRRRNPGLVRHVETHTFRLVAPIPDPAAWRVNVVSDPALAAYAAREAPWVERGLYRCSAGLVADTLGAPLELFLAEAHEPTHEALAAALAEEELPVRALLDDAHRLATLRPRTPAPMLVHVDPFDHPSGYWPTVEAMLVWRGDHDAIVLAFGYDKSAPIVWPAPPAGLMWLGRRDTPKYGVAAWATEGIAPEAVAALGALGWGP